jgi:hypothetical protein
MKLIGSLVLVLATAISAHATNTLNNFTYRVKLQSMENQTCDQHAAQVATAFASANGKAVTNVTGACQSQQMIDGSQIDIVVVSYQAAYEVQPYRATIEGEQFSTETGASSEPFATYASCLGSINGQVSFFVAETGLSAVAAYCSASTSDLVSGYTLTVEGFGKPQKKLSSFMNTGVLGPDYTVIVPTAAHLITSAYGDISFQDHLRIFYYSSQRIDVSVHDFSYFENHECEDQQGIAERIATASSLTNVSSMCLADLGTSKRLIVVGLGYSGFADDFGNHAPDYSSYNECVQDRPRMLATNSTWYIGALCEPSTGGKGHYQLHMFSKNY